MVSHRLAVGRCAAVGTLPVDQRKAEAKSATFRGPTLYLFVGGLLALLVVPFLPWLYYGPLNLLFPSQVSLIYLFERGGAFTGNLELYLAGVAIAACAAAVAGRPVLYQGVPSAAFPVLILIVTTMTWVQSGYHVYPQAFTVGMLTALLGSVLLEASYFSYRRKETHA